MTAKKWRAKGYKTIIINGNIYLFKEDVIAWTPINNGAWLRSDSIHDTIWSYENLIDMPEQLQKKINNAVKNCYCDKGVDICDFCSCLR